MEFFHSQMGLVKDNPFKWFFGYKIIELLREEMTTRFGPKRDDASTDAPKLVVQNGWEHDNVSAH